MPISKQMLGVYGDECQCGRRMTVRHCPACGSFRIYGRTGRLHKHLDGTLKLVETQFRCQACTHLFIDEERQFCEAPAVGKKLASQRVAALHDAAQTGEPLSDAERTAALSVVRALKEGKTLEETAKVELTDDQYTKLVWDVKREYADKKFAFLSKKGDNPGTIEEYVPKRMKELGFDYPRENKVEQAEAAQ